MKTQRDNPQRQITANKRLHYASPKSPSATSDTRKTLDEMPRIFRGLK